MVIVGVNPGRVVSMVEPDSPALARLFAESTGVTFPVGFDTSASYRAYAQRGSSISPFPLDVVVGPDGRVAYVSQKYEPEALRAVIDRLLEAPQ
ncbi:MAG: hypothetical protein AAFU79_10395 [Myxococcota bacterium]